MKIKHQIDYVGLESYLKTLHRDEIETNHRKPETPKLIEGHSILEIEYFKADINKYQKETIIQYGEPFLVDAIGNDLSIVILTRRRYKLPTGRVVNCKFVKTIIADCHKIYGTALNGYWKIPSQFIKPIKP